MSTSRKLQEALILTRTLKSRQLMHSDFPIIKSLHPKSQLIQCRKCEGMGTISDGANNCPQCGGKGVEKLSMKAYNRELKKQQVAVKTAPAKEQEDLHEKEDSK
jgi:hypothetical protein